MFNTEARTHGIKFEYFHALPGSPKESFNRSHLAILKQFVDSDDDMMLLLEDDCQFRHLQLLDNVMSEIPPDFDMIYFGVNSRPYDGFALPEYESVHLRRLKSGYTTHAIVYKKSVAKYITDTFVAEGYEGMYDQWLDENILKQYKVYVTVPFLAVQRPVRSDLWNRPVDYTDTFVQAEIFLKSVL